MSNREILIKFVGVKITVGGNYIPSTPPVMYYKDGSGHPGDPSEFEIDYILYDGTDVSEIYESLGSLDLISQLCIEEIDSNYEDT